MFERVMYDCNDKRHSQNLGDWSLHCTHTGNLLYVIQELDFIKHCLNEPPLIEVAVCYQLLPPSDGSRRRCFCLCRLRLLQNELFVKIRPRHELIDLFRRYCYVYVFLLVMSVYSYCMFMYLHRASWHSSATLTEVFPCFSSVVRQMPGYNSPRRGTVRTLPKIFVLFCVLFVLCRSGYCLYVNVYCTTATGWQRNCSLTNISLLRLRVTSMHETDV